MYRVYELRSRRLMRFSDFQEGIGASLKIWSWGALELFFFFVGECFATYRVREGHCASALFTPGFDVCLRNEETFLVSIVKYFIVDRLYIVSMLFIYCEVFQGPMW